MIKSCFTWSRRIVIDQWYSMKGEDPMCSLKPIAFRAVTTWDSSTWWTENDFHKRTPHCKKNKTALIKLGNPQGRLVQRKTACFLLADKADGWLAHVISILLCNNTGSYSIKILILFCDTENIVRRLISAGSLNFKVCCFPHFSLHQSPSIVIDFDV